jgi:single-stranded DNA-binding protein
VEIPFFGKMSEITREYLSRGLSVYVEGRLKKEEREGKEDDRSRVKRSSDLS